MAPLQLSKVPSETQAAHARASLGWHSSKTAISLIANVSAGHVQSEDSACENRPCGHVVHSKAPAAEYVLSGQLVHMVGVALNLPAGQFEQGVAALRSSSKVPARHSMQSETDDAPDKPYVPGGQIPLQKKSAASIVYVPAEQV